MEGVFDNMVNLPNSEHKGKRTLKAASDVISQSSSAHKKREKNKTEMKDNIWTINRVTEL